MPFLPLLSLVWGNDTTRMIAIAGATFLAGWWLGFRAVPVVDVAAIVRNAQDGRDGEWTRKLQQANHEHELELSEAINAADAVPALAADASLVELCKSDASCRDKGVKRR
jgi:hypothetical protein